MNDDDVLDNSIEEPRLFGRFEVFSIESANELDHHLSLRAPTATRPRNVSAPPTTSSATFQANHLQLDSIPDEIPWSELRFGARIGQGAFGEVFKGELYGQEIAIKQLLIKDSQSRGSMRRFLREVEIMRSLRHPNIVEFMGVCFHETNVCMITEYMRKGSLHDVLRSRTHRWPWKRYLRLAQDVVRGLNWLHNRGIIHRDLKPSNLLVTRNNRVKIADFGLSHVKRSPGPQLGTYGVCGTPCYMAPEVLLKLPYSFKADVFSLGMVLCEMITGRYPLRDLRSLASAVSLNSNDYEHAIISGVRPAVPQDVPEGLGRLIESCWEHEPGKRPTVQEVMDQLAGIEMELDQALQDALDEAFDDVPEQVRTIIREQQQRTKELRDALTDTHVQIDEGYGSIAKKQNTLKVLKKQREELERTRMELVAKKRLAEQELRLLSGELREWRLAVYHSGRKQSVEEKQQEDS